MDNESVKVRVLFKSGTSWTLTMLRMDYEAATVRILSREYAGVLMGEDYILNLKNVVAMEVLK